MQWFSVAHSQLPHISWNALSLFGTLLIGGLIGGQCITKISWMPRLTGYLLIGFALGPECLQWVSGDIFSVMHIFADIAIAIIVYQLGRYVDVRWLIHERWLVATVVASSMLTFLLIWQLLSWTGMASPTAMLVAILAIGTSPAIIVAVIRDIKAEGHITRRLAALTALNNVIALIGAYLILPLASSGEIGYINDFVLHTAYSLGGSFLLAYAAYVLLIPLARWLGHRRQQQFVLVVAVITLTLGIAHAFQLPVLLTMLTFAILSRNLDRRYDLMDVRFDAISEPFIILLFVTFGAAMQLPKLSIIATAAGLVILARCIAMAAGIFGLAKPAKLSWKQAAMLTLGCLPITESSLGLIQLSTVYPHVTADLLPLLSGVMVVFEILGPIATQFALRASGESSPHKSSPA
jgi:Kef-type K+ transport system membrane component KefB